MSTTKERLAQALEQAKAPLRMIADARRGRFDCFESKSRTPLRDLVEVARWFGLDDIVARAIAGEFDATEEEAGAWLEAREAQEARGVSPLTG